MEKSRKKRLAALAVMIPCLAVLVVLSRPYGASGQEVKMKKGALKKADQNLYPQNEYGWLTYYMHEVYERYVQARKAFEEGQAGLAEANLRVMQIFADLSKEHLPDALQDGRPFDGKGYVKTVEKLNSHAEDAREKLGQGKWPEAGKGEMEPIMQTCVGCHDAYNIPTDFRIDTKFKVLTHSMHEIYELYRQAGRFLQQEEWDKASYCFKVAMPYIETIPENIPEKNQDGEKIDKKLFTGAYKELRRYTEDMIERLETRKWMTGKPLPPPRIVVDNCYACHAKVANIPSPW